jgi:AcrR family transcriptional regulator
MMSSIHRGRETLLERTLNGDTERPTPLDALRTARRMWLHDQRLDMGALATELGISRATLYNWVGDRERLLGEVLWSIAEATIARAREQATGSGADFISDVTERYLHQVAGSQPVRSFLAADPELALRVLTCNRTVFQERLIAAVRELIEQQVDSVGYQPPLDPPTLAYLLVRIGESFIFNDVITGSEPDLRKAAQASWVLLHAPPS